MNENQFYEELYKASDTGFDAITILIGKVNDKKLHHDMMLHMDGYRHFSGIAKNHLEEAKQEPKKENVMKRIPARIGMTMHTMFDTSTGHIAEMMITGSGMGIVEMSRNLNRLRENHASEEAIGVCRNMIDFEQNNIDRMKKYL